MNFKLIFNCSVSNTLKGFEIRCVLPKKCSSSSSNLPYRRLFEASQKMMMLQFEDVLFEVLVERQACGLGSHFGFCSLLLGHECRPGSGFCDLDACESGFLQSQKEWCHQISVGIIIICYVFVCISDVFELEFLVELSQNQKNT